MSSGSDDASYSRANHDPKNSRMVKAFFRDGSISGGPVDSIEAVFGLAPDALPCEGDRVLTGKFIEPVGVKSIHPQVVSLGIRYVASDTYFSNSPKYLTFVIYNLNRKMYASDSKFKDIFMGNKAGLQRLVSFVKLIFYRILYFNRCLPDGFVTDVLPDCFFDSLTSFVNLPREFKLSKKSPPGQAWKGVN